MIIDKVSKGYMTRSDKPNENWTNEDVFVVEDGSKLALKIENLYPHYNFVLDKDGNLTDVEEETTGLLDRYKENKISELYSAYQSEKNNVVTSSLIGDDGNPITFGYSEDNRADYRSIGVKFSLNDAITTSIIGSHSHGKYQITREDFSTLISDFDRHETDLYVKFKNLKTQTENALERAELEAITWE